MVRLNSSGRSQGQPGRGSSNKRGSAMVEMTLIGIPIIFVLISIFEIARGMWIYNSLAFAAKEGTRYASVHGVNCTNSPNTCTITRAAIAAKIRDSAMGLNPALMEARFCVNCGTGGGGPVDDTTLLPLSTLLGQNSVWPTSAGNAVHGRIVFTVQYPFDSALAMFWPGVGRGIRFSRFVLIASAGEAMHF